MISSSEMKIKSGFTDLFPGSRRVDLSHHPDSGAGINALLLLLLILLLPPPRRCFYAEPGAVVFGSGHSCSHQQQRQSGVMWPKCGCPSGSLIPTYGYSIPTLLHGSTRGKFSSAGCSLIQFGGETAPPWTGDGLWRRRACQDHQPIGVYTGRRCFSRWTTVTKRYLQPERVRGLNLGSKSPFPSSVIHFTHVKFFEGPFLFIV